MITSYKHTSLLASLSVMEEKSFITLTPAQSVQCSSTAGICLIKTFSSPPVTTAKSMVCLIFESKAGAYLSGASNGAPRLGTAPGANVIKRFSAASYEFS